jgi:hypothetical protein
MFYDIYIYTLCYYICCLLWRMYEMHPALFFKTGCYRTLSPHKDHHTIGVSCFDYKCLGNKNRGRRKVIQAQELKRTRQNSLF